VHQVERVFGNPSGLDKGRGMVIVYARNYLSSIRAEPSDARQYSTEALCH
jgi:hypothetical protein